MALADLNLAPVRCLREDTKKALARGLDSRRVLPTDEGLGRDWCGLAAALGDLVPSYVSGALLAGGAASPTRELLRYWADGELQRANLGSLAQILAQIDRYDVLHDVTPLLEADALYYLNNGDKVESTVQTRRVSNDDNILTVDDVNLSRQGHGSYQKYNALILYADEDHEFAKEVISRMEESGLKLCEKDRDLVAGNSEHLSICRIITERCDRVLVILSPNFFKSPVNKFFTNLAQHIGIENEKRVIVPCIYQRCELPVHLRHLYCLDYQKSGRLWNFWDKLEESLVTTHNVVIREIESQTSPLSIMANTKVPQIEYPSSVISNNLSVSKITTSSDRYDSLTVPNKVFSSSVDDINRLKVIDDGLNSMSISSRSSVSVCENGTTSIAANENPEIGEVHKSKFKIPKFFRRKTNKQKKLWKKSVGC